MTRKKGPGFAVLYRWQIKPDKEQQFIDAWSRISEGLLKERGSLGSRLHKGSDGIWYSYAQWPTAQSREHAFSLPPIDSDAMLQMREAISESLPEIVLESLSDFMVMHESSDANL